MDTRHKATVGVFGIPEKDGKGIWAKRSDGKGVNAIGGGMDEGEDPIEALKREFREEVGVEISVGRLLGVFPLANMKDFAVLYDVVIVDGEPTTSDETAEICTMDPSEVLESVKRYDDGDHENGLVSGTGKRQHQMANAFFKSRK